VAVDRLRQAVFKIVLYTGLPFLFREIIQKNMVTVILFHDLEKSAAEKAFSYLVRKYNIIRLSDYVKAIEKKDKSSIPPKALIITFDDGLIKNYDLAETLKNLNVPVNIFLCASIVGTRRHFWDKDQSIPISKLKQITNAERLSYLSGLGFKQDKEFDSIQALQKEQIEEMKKIIDFQSHTLFHSILPKCTREESRAEIYNSKEILEKDFNLNIYALSYPNGDYSERDIRLAKEAGYRCGITVDFGFNTTQTDAFKIKRLCMGDNGDLNELAAKASGAWGFLSLIFLRRRLSGLMRSLEG
jgi:poly-beta-1,6-N-acetyl-D-glucosamine N-deacetylase